MFHLIYGVPWLVVVLRFVMPLPWHISLRLSLAVILLMGSQYHFFSRLSSGSVFDPEFARPLIIAFNWVMGAMILVFVFQIVLDVVWLLVMAVKGAMPIPAGIRYALGVAALCLSAFAVQQAIRVPPQKDIEITIPGLPPAFDGYQMVQLTDLHISRLFTASWVDKVVEKANALDADLIVMTGDLIDGSVEHRRQDVAPMARLSARDGVYAIPGNHEYFFDHGAWMEEYERLNLRTLLNDHIVLSRGDDRLVIAGVNDLSASRTGAPPPDVPRAVNGAPAGAPIILLDHQPMMAARNAESGIALQLSGHTHGGMIVGLAALVARANNGFVSGLYQVGNMQLYVNNGTALWPGFALRLGPQPELTRITLRRTELN